MTQPPLPYGRQEILDEDIREVVACLREDFLTQGPRVARFEEALASAVGARHAVAVANGTAALHLAVLGMGLGPGDLGVVPSVTFVATANCLRYAGADVAFADVGGTDGLVDLRHLETLCEELSPKLVIPVHLAGQPVDLPRVAAIAERHGARVLEDAAHALGAAYEDGSRTIRVGSCEHSDAAIFSFHPVKHITTAEGGAIVTNDSVLHSRLVDLRTHGIHKDPSRLSRSPEDPFAGPWYYEQDSLGFNYRLSDLQCALGISQLGRLEGNIARRRELAAKYDRALGEAPLRGRLRPLRQWAGRHNAFHLYVIQVVPHDDEPLEELARRRRLLYDHLHARGIRVQVHYIPVHWQPYHAHHADPVNLPGADRYYASSLSLPMFHSMRDDDVDRVLDALRDWTHRAG